jgi:hypothetical protein
MTVLESVKRQFLVNALLYTTAFYYYAKIKHHSKIPFKLWFKLQRFLIKNKTLGF